MIRGFWFYVLLIGLSIAGLSSCHGLPKDRFIGCWVDSYEENAEYLGKQIYRPCTYPNLPPSRFRFRFELLANGSCSYLHLAPNDAHFMKAGTWEYNQHDNSLIIKDMHGNSIKAFHEPEFIEDRLHFNL